jgi:hypothetical protein
MKGSRNACLAVAWAVSALAIFCPIHLCGQSTFGTILGSVVDEKAAVIPGVEVVLTHQDTNVQRRATSNEVGRFEFLDLVAGAYRLEARQDGFKAFVQKDIGLSTRQTIRVDALMEVGAVTETVTVKATAGLIATETASVTGIVAGGEVFFLSPNSTSQRPWELMRLDPLVQNTNSATRFSMGGAYFNQSEFQIDGISAPLGTGQVASSMVMSSEALQEVSIQAVNNQAEYASPGVFQQISKGGANTVVDSRWSASRMLQLRRNGVVLAGVLGRNGVCRMQQGMKSLSNRSSGRLGDSSNHRGESRKRVGAALRFGALRNLTGNHRWPECPFRSIVGGLNGRVVEESQDPA